jgi:hypothetical protein
MHVVAATFIEMARCPLPHYISAEADGTEVFYMYFHQLGNFVYKEILGDDFQSIAAVPSNENNAILIGGRNEVRYSFQK